MLLSCHNEGSLQWESEWNKHVFNHMVIICYLCKRHKVLFTGCEKSIWEGIPWRESGGDLAQCLLFSWLVIEPINLEYAIVCRWRLVMAGTKCLRDRWLSCQADRGFIYSNWILQMHDCFWALKVKTKKYVKWHFDIGNTLNKKKLLR